MKSSVNQYRPRARQGISGRISQRGRPIFGELAERPIASGLNPDTRQRDGGSNPSLSAIFQSAGWRNLAAHRVHKLDTEVVGSNPSPATNHLGYNPLWSGAAGAHLQGHDRDLAIRYLSSCMVGTETPSGIKLGFRPSPVCHSGTVGKRECYSAMSLVLGREEMKAPMLTPGRVRNLSHSRMSRSEKGSLFPSE